MSYYSTPEGKDPQLWHVARKRATFKSHLTTYLLVNAGLWISWYFTGARNYGGGLPWPAWSLLGWGIGLVSHYMSAYHNDGANTVEREYEKLKQNQTK